MGIQQTYHIPLRKVNHVQSADISHFMKTSVL
jgi:hypothetical protein